MARPLRIEFPGAWYHVMNRGAGYRSIFSQDEHRSLFLDLLGEVSRMFRVETHAYCLMDNHYHLLVHTPEGNLQRGMRHLNGVYTQRYNRMEKTDGALFRGRYKAILIEPDAYLLNVSRYIHLNPVAAGLTEKAADFPWSSFRTYVGEALAPEWLRCDFVLGMIGQRRQQERYRSFVEAGMDEVTETFYSEGKRSPIFGSDGFRAGMLSNRAADPEIPEIRQAVSRPSLALIVAAVAEVFSVKEEQILQQSRGRGRKNTARSAALYVARKIAGFSLHEIVSYFGLGHYASVSGAVTRFQKAIAEEATLEKMITRVADKIKTKI